MVPPGAATVTGAGPYHGGVAAPSTAPVQPVGATVMRGLRSLFEVADPDDRSSRAVVVAVWAVWTVVAAVAMFSHEPWRDELQAWALAKSAATPLDVLPAIRGEGHPPGWYLLLWPATRVFPSAFGLQVMALVAASTATWLTLRHLPLTIGVRALVVFTYFPMFELAVVARHYVLGYALLIAALWLAHRPGTPPWVVAVVLLALAGTSVIAAPVALAIAIGLWGGRLFSSPGRQPARWGLVAVIAGVLVAGFVIARPSQGGGAPIDLSVVGPSSLWASLAAPLRAVLPVSPLEINFWGNLTVARWGVWAEVLGLGVIVAVALAVRRSRSALTIWLVGTVGFLFTMVAAEQSLAPRIVSTVWMAGIAALWVAAADRRRSPAPQRQPVHPAVLIGAVAVLAAGLWAAGWALWADTGHPFSSGTAAAEWIRDQADGDVVILCMTEQPYCATVANRLDVPAYRSATDEPFTHVVWRKGWRTPIEFSQAPANARALAERTGAEVFVVSRVDQFPPGCGRGWRPTEPTISELVMVCRGDQLRD